MLLKLKKNFKKRSKKVIFFWGVWGVGGEGGFFDVC